MKKKGIIIMPAYNEGKVITEVLKKVLDESSKQQYYDLDLALINDGSTDDTERQVSTLPVILISHLVNMGSGAATRTGLEFAKRNNYDFAVTIDADGQHSTKDLIKVINKLIKEKYDLVIGSRLMNSEGMPVIRVFGNKILNFATRVILGVSVTDSQSGLKAFSQEAIKKIEIRSDGFEFCSEIVWRAKQQNLKIAEIPIKAIYTDYSLKKGQNNINALRIVKNLIRQKVREV
jgi:glycosyltransferase involved in cell wall biosynthesis